ncbi:D-glycero-beta-D-manno-heptose 1,7-bisphosphate 7-phosphatase [Inmirania thermothiophila]|uniref:D,D-heptose 1,7-bisphosphate phosphatase n=1 Tax=Inmirania thermothiophila TaxID=1750597 RepID=A0A3N1Y9R8_9GAMM|nr:D-glycero-beta-D-manno-heptose 1,7-bisphosphate 7-phosphatase [Inmirania thermothiophila]ROR34362.1 D-alpha,beta-D-heptose 1,7-bisphosphate phosphatase [Inmirania thermothiophila]
MALVILDRDGVLNHDSEAFIKSPAEWVPIPGSLEAVARLHQAGHTVVVATNQSGIARGLLDLEALTAIHAVMRRALAAVGAAVDLILFCPHGPREGCACRKPRPGMLLEAAARTGLPLAGAPVVGDAARDLEAARAAGATPVLVRTGKGAATEAEGGPELAGVAVFDDLAAFVTHWLGEARCG